MKNIKYLAIVIFFLALGCHKEEGVKLTEEMVDVNN